MDKRSMADADYADYKNDDDSDDDGPSTARYYADWIIDVVWNVMRATVTVAIAILVILSVITYLAQIFTHHA